MSQGQYTFGTGHLDSEGSRDSPFSDISARGSNINCNSDSNCREPPMFRNYHSTPTNYSSFSSMSPDTMIPNTSDEFQPATPAHNSQFSSSPRPFDGRQSDQKPYQAEHKHFPRISIPSDYNKLESGTPAPTTSSPHPEHLENFKRALATHASSRISAALPQVHLGHLLQPTYLPPGPPPCGPPYTPSSFVQTRIPKSAAATAYVDEVIWRPSTGVYGVPTTEAQKGFYVRKICLSLVNLYDLWDDPKDLLTAAVKFADTGIWSDQKDIETTAHLVVSAAVRIHNYGVSGVPFRRSPEFESLNAEDMDFTFPQRIHYLERLFYHSKVAADNVMSGRDVVRYAALPLTSLRRIPLFEDE
ncbi:hypothetical protein G6011_04328 [Alternaria panax]|uniref:Uncharacterized protein n=1 Tax=Alternaria panax TaxID=48097 RepID=A0AAD4IH11_9PLEO|nr:hypothetical protein G6011_04328 [Alternaria panax]